MDPDELREHFDQIGFDGKKCEDSNDVEEEYCSYILFAQACPRSCGKCKGKTSIIGGGTIKR